MMLWIPWTLERRQRQALKIVHQTRPIAKFTEAHIVFASGEVEDIDAVCANVVLARIPIAAIVKHCVTGRHRVAEILVTIVGRGCWDNRADDERVEEWRPTWRQRRALKRWHAWL